MNERILISNPAAGGGRGRRAAESVVRMLRERGEAVEARFTAAPGDGRRLATEALSEGARRFVVCGGDGTLGEVAGALAGTGAALGLVPCGRGNDFARALGIPRNPEAAVRVLLEGAERRVDLGRVEDRRFCTVACAGFDAETARTVRERRVPFSGAAAYALAVFRTLGTYRCPEIRLSGDFGIREGPALLVAVGNTGFYGGGMRILPGARPDDGRLDLCVIDPLPRLRLLRSFPRIYKGTHLDMPEVSLLRGRSVRLESAPPLTVYADGEPVCQTPATIEVEEKALTVVVPAAKSR